MKYNDIAVTKSSWEELVRDSFGGYRNASAYCLMYINDKAQFLIQGKMMHHHHYYCLKVIYLLFLCMSVLPACIRVHCIRAWCLCAHQKIRVDPLELELQTVIKSHYMDVGDCIHVLKDSKFS